MKFIDEAIIEVTAGDGGDGCASFRREKYVPKGGPDGGDGGRGGHVIFETDEGRSTLMDVQFKRHFKAGRGGHGMGKQMYGRAGEDCRVALPVGTVIFDAERDEKLFDLDHFPCEVLVAKGGRGGRGNMHYASSTNQAPRKYQTGEKGESRKLRLELKLLADVGLIGLPNAGKSTFISAVSNVRPKIADYPFTTKVPHLGVVQLAEGDSCVMADIPGLLEGASQGAGMGIQFLRHIERTRILLHLIDTTDPAHPNPVKNYATIRHELESYNASLQQRPEIVCLTKMDLPEARENSTAIKALLAEQTAAPVFFISAATGEGLKEVLYAIRNVCLAASNAVL